MLVKCYVSAHLVLLQVRTFWKVILQQKRSFSFRLTLPLGIIEWKGCRMENKTTLLLIIRPAFLQFKLQVWMHLPDTRQRHSPNWAISAQKDRLWWPSYEKDNNNIHWSFYGITGMLAVQLDTIVVIFLLKFVETSPICVLFCWYLL